MASFTQTHPSPGRHRGGSKLRNEQPAEKAEGLPGGKGRTRALISQIFSEAMFLGYMPWFVGERNVPE